MNDDLMDTFENESTELYRLAYLLTGNEDRSVQAFSKALDLGEEANAGFHGFLSDWARKLVAAEALATIEPELRQSKARVARKAAVEAAGRWKPLKGIAQKEFEEAVVAIEAFPRCAMLLTIFEGMTMKAAAALLNASEALTGVAQGMGIVQLMRNLAGDSGRDPFPQGHAPIPVLSLG